MAKINPGHSAVDMPGDLKDAQVAVTPEPPPSTGEIQDMKKAQKDLSMASALSLVLSALAITNNLTASEFSGNSSIQLLSITYDMVLLTALFFGLLLLLLSVALPHLPISATLKTKLIWTAIGLIAIVLVLKMSILLGTYAISK